MRLVKQIPHEHFLVQLHHYNNKYILSITLDEYEQSFKVPSENITNTDLFETALSSEFYSACLQDFLNMRTRWLKIQQQLQ